MKNRINRIMLSCELLASIAKLESEIFRLWAIGFTEMARGSRAADAALADVNDSIDRFYEKEDDSVAKPPKEPVAPKFRE